MFHSWILISLLISAVTYVIFREKGWLPKKSIRGKHIYLTGAGSGLGRGMALKLAQLGANLTLCDINEAGLLETKLIIKKETGRDQNILTIKVDVSNRSEISESAKLCKSRFGKVDILINNAGIVQGKQILDLNEKLASKCFTINCESHLWLIREFLADMITEDSGQIVSVASMAGIAGNAYMADYCASKFGAVGLQESLRIEMKLARKNVVCTTICPYMINTGMFEGAKGSMIFPFLEAEYVIQRMTNAILQQEEDVTIPWSQGVLAHISKGLFPSCINDQIVKFLLGWDFMKSFHGRSINESKKTE